MPQDITAIILTYNEEIHIERCIQSVQKVCSNVLVVDSYSQDRTCKIAEGLGARVVQHPFENQAKQFNWAIDNIEISSEWIWRVDADEIIEDKLVKLVFNEVNSEKLKVKSGEQLVVAPYFFVLLIKHRKVQITNAFGRKIFSYN